MKRSNLYLILLFALLYVFPLFVWTAYACLGYKSYTRISDQYRIIRIENPDLTAKQVLINTEKTSYFPEREMMAVTGRSYLYYKGYRHYLPDLQVSGDTILIAKPQGTDNKDLTFNIHIPNLKTVILNGQVIWGE